MNATTTTSSFTFTQFDLSGEVVYSTICETAALAFRMVENFTEAFGLRQFSYSISFPN